MEVEKPILTASEPEVMRMRQAPIMAIQPSGEEVEMAAVVTTPPVAELKPDAEPTQVAAAELPKTASPMPLMALFGLLALGAGFTARLARKRLL